MPAQRPLDKRDLGEGTAQTAAVVDDLAAALGLHAGAEAALALLPGRVANLEMHGQSSGPGLRGTGDVRWTGAQVK